MATRKGSASSDWIVWKRGSEQNCLRDEVETDLGKSHRANDNVEPITQGLELGMIPRGRVTNEDCSKDSDDPCCMLRLGAIVADEIGLWWLISKGKQGMDDICT
jgi:hypothetical protein